MIAYIDTSVLIKLLVEESGSDVAAVVWDRASQLVTSRITIVEARAALAAAVRARRLTSAAHRTARAELGMLWSQLAIVEITADIVDQAGDLAERHGLRVYDAMHLAAAVAVGAEVIATADRALAAAGRDEGLHVIDPAAHGGAEPIEPLPSRPSGNAPPDGDIAARMVRDSGLCGIPVPVDSVDDGGGFRAEAIGTIQEITAFYEDRMSTDGWILDAAFSRLEPYEAEDRRLGYLTCAYYAKPTSPVTTVGIIVGNADGRPGRKRDVVIRLVRTPDDELPAAAQRAD